MPLINIANRNNQAGDGAVPTQTTVTTTTITPAALPPLKGSVSSVIPQAQEIGQPEIRTSPDTNIQMSKTPTEQIVNEKADLNNLTKEINNITKTLPESPVVPTQTSMGSILDQVKQAVGTSPQASVPAPTVGNNVQFNSSESESLVGSGASDLILNSNVSMTSANGAREIKPVENTAAAQPMIDPSNKLDEKLNKINNTQSTTPGVLPPPGGDLVNKTYVLKDFLEEAMKQNASDVHISVGYRVMIRVNGELKTIQSPLVTQADSEGYVMDLLKGRKETKLEDINEYDMTYSLGSRRFRINIFRESNTLAIAARVISEKIPTLEELDLPPIMKEFSKYPNGLVLVTGPTGSGKSTTIASIINLINTTDSKHIITLEDPIEYVFPKSLSMVDQRESGQDFTSWGNALRAILRQDPNIVLVGEMRDLETVEAALRIAETGHLVFATLHTNSASQTVDRIIDMFPAEKQEQVKVQLASVLQAVISQRLVKTLNNSRVASLEILIGTSAVKNTIRESKGIQLDNIIQTGFDLGMISMEKSLVKLVKEGKVSAEAAKIIANRPNDFDILLNRG
ncbi:MAG: type IV pilus twitching motility protein PilT [Candidatus Dojkabacteria bacterium]